MDGVCRPDLEALRGVFHTDAHNLYSSTHYLGTLQIRSAPYGTQACIDARLLQKSFLEMLRRDPKAVSDLNHTKR